MPNPTATALDKAAAIKAFARLEYELHRPGCEWWRRSDDAKCDCRFRDDISVVRARLRALEAKKKPGKGKGAGK